MAILSKKSLKPAQASALATALSTLDVMKRLLAAAKDRVTLTQGRLKDAESALAALCKEEGIDLPAGASVQLVSNADGSTSAVVSKADAKHDAAPKPKAAEPPKRPKPQKPDVPKHDAPKPDSHSK